MQILEKNKLEQLIVAHWAEFLNVQSLIAKSKEFLVLHHNLPPNLQIFQIKISHCEVTNGLLLWLEVIVAHSGSRVNATLEALATFDGDMSYVNGLVDQTTST